MATESHPSFPPPELREVSQSVASFLKAHSQTVSVVETAAGGLISAALLSQPGASAYFKGGLNLYTLPSRVAFGGWTQETIANYGGPTTDVVSGLAKHVRAELGSTYTLAESGTAGPTGGTARNRTPGYVALAVEYEGGGVVKEVETGLGTDRVANMVKFAEQALVLLLAVMKAETGSQG